MKKNDTIEKAKTRIRLRPILKLLQLIIINKLKKSEMKSKNQELLEKYLEVSKEYLNIKRELINELSNTNSIILDNMWIADGDYMYINVDVDIDSSIQYTMIRDQEDCIEIDNIEVDKNLFYIGNDLENLIEKTKKENENYLSHFEYHQKLLAIRNNAISDIKKYLREKNVSLKDENSSECYYSVKVILVSNKNRELTSWNALLNGKEIIDNVIIKAGILKNFKHDTSDYIVNKYQLDSYFDLNNVESDYQVIDSGIIRY